MSERTADAATLGQLMARLGAMQARLDEQQAEMVEQRAEIARLRTGAAGTAAHRVGVVKAEPKVSRRGMLAKSLGATAAAAVLTVSQEASRAEAATRATLLSGSGTTNSYGLLATFGVTSDPSNALPSLGGRSFGVIGTVTTSALTPPRSAGVWGLGDAFDGVLGTSNGGYGVYALSQSGPGVFGGSNSGNGVYANSNAATGVYSTAPQKGVWGRTTGGIGVFGQATQASGYGVYGAAGAGGWAGYFEGNVYVTGQVFTPGGALSMAQAADGSQRTLYSQDSTEPLVEDVGESKLVGGRANVKLDADFAAIAEGGAYQVFLTPEGDCKGLYVTGKAPGGFDVRELQGGTASLAFSYRIVAKRKGATGKRLEKLVRPKALSAKDLEPPKLPEAVVPPEKPAAEPKPERRDAR